MQNSDDACPIPCISYRVLLHGDPESQLQAIREMNGALKSYGACRIRDHGIPQDIINICFDKSRRFFERSLEEKLADYRGSGATMNCRFVPFASETVCGETHLDEALELDHRVYEQPGNWSIPAKQLLDASKLLHQECDRIHYSILDRLSLSTRLPRCLNEIHNENNSFLAPYYYFFDGMDDTNAIRVPPHIDPTTFVFCFPDSLGGLEVADIRKMDNISTASVKKSAQFIPIPYQKGEFILLAGQVLRRLTGELKHSVHQVRRPVGTPGFHLNYWTVPNLNTVLGGNKEDVASYLARVFPASLRTRHRVA